MPTVRLGRNASLNRNTGTYGSPTWSAIGNVRDLRRSGETVEADVGIRASGAWEATQPVGLNATIEFDCIFDPADADIAALRSAWLNRTLVDMAVMDRPITEVGAAGIRGYWAVTQFDEDQQRGDINRASVTLKPGLGSEPMAEMVVQ
ncbi:MAG: hypothetical protein U0840_25670 [Gemmataceae bacterium]